jgi:hypothetical protein
MGKYKIPTKGKLFRSISKKEGSNRKVTITCVAYGARAPWILFSEEFKNNILKIRIRKYLDNVVLY